MILRVWEYVVRFSVSQLEFCAVLQCVKEDALIVEQCLDEYSKAS